MMYQKLLFSLLLITQLTTHAAEPFGYSAPLSLTAIPDTLDPPSCTAAPNLTVWCDLFDPSLAAYPGITDQSANVDSIAMTVDYSQFDTLCSRGVITRSFTVFDSEGETGVCSQQIQVDYRQDYFIRFPDDVIATTCQPSGQYGQPVFFGNDCELVSATYEDAMITVVPDACFRIDRRWSVISWCTFNPAQGLVQVPNPNPSAIANHPSNLPGPVVSPIDTLGHPWSASQVLVSPGNSFPTNYAIFYNPAANGYEYTQRIKIIDTTDPRVLSASETNTLDVTANNSMLWNALFWWDDLNQTHDLCEGPTDISITVTDDCSGGNLQISFLLSLDLDGDGIMETGINSDALGANGIGWNNVPFGNLVMGNGTPRTFDNRPVLPGMKYGFALEQVMNGLEKTARVRFNTLEQPNQYINPELPHGVHKIRWFISDGCGNEAASEHLIVVRDGKAPTVVCLQPLSVNIMPTNLITLWATDFLQYAEDNCTPTDWLRYGLRKAGSGTGFPVDQNGNPITNVTFTCNELGANVVELWCIDQAGNSDFCEAFVMVQDNNQNCGTAPMQISGNISTETNSPIEGVPVRFYSGSTFAPPFSYNVVTDNNGNYTVPVNLPVISNGYLQPQSDDQPLNGVTTFDLVLLSKHILGLEPLGSPYKIIAGDANNSKSLTTFDIVELRKLILGIYTDLPANYSWRFVLKSYVFPNPLNPFQPLFPDTVRFMAFNQNPNAGDFIGIKIGDLNNSAIVNNLAAPDERLAGEMAFRVETDRRDDLLVGETISLQFKATQPMVGCQFTLDLGGLEILEIKPGRDMERDHFASFPEKDALTVAWETGGQPDFTLACRATQAGNLRDLLSVSSRITRAEAYAGESAQRYGLSLQFPVLGQFEVYQNRPNPFDGETRIAFNLPEPGEVTLQVFDASGKLLQRQTGNFDAGLQFFALLDAGSIPSGLCYYQVSTAREQAVRKMVKQ
jgi:hypothetical protein